MSFHRKHGKHHQCDNCGNTYEDWRTEETVICVDGECVGEDSVYLTVERARYLLANNTRPLFFCADGCSNENAGGMWNLWWAWVCDECGEYHYDRSSAMDCCGSNSDSEGDEDGERIAPPDAGEDPQVDMDLVNADGVPAPAGVSLPKSTVERDDLMSSGQFG